MCTAYFSGAQVWAGDLNSGVIAQRQAFIAVRLGDVTEGRHRYGEEVLEAAPRSSNGGRGEEEDPAK